MNKTMKRLFGIAALMMVSMVAGAQVKVDISEGITGGTVTAAVEAPSEEDGSVVVTLTVTPDPGYYITKDDLVVVATMPLPQQPAEPAETRADGEGKDVVLEGVLELTGDDPANLSDPREYSFTLQQGLGAWVQKADFHVLTTLELGDDVTSLDDESLAGVSSITIKGGFRVIELGRNDVTGIDVIVPGHLYNAYMAADGWSSANIVSPEAVSMEGVKFVEDQNQYDVYVSSEQDLMVPVGVLAYDIIGIQGNRILLDDVKVIAKGKPVLLYSENIKTNDLRTAVAQEMRTRADDEKEPITDCALKVAPAGGRQVTLGEVYLLYNDKFYLSQAGTIPEGNIYLEITKEELQQRTRSFLTIGGDDDTTAIDASHLSPLYPSDVWHDLSGRRLYAQPTAKGIYIFGGKKVVIK